jgi:hypothetical protein
MALAVEVMSLFRHFTVCNRATITSCIGDGIGHTAAGLDPMAKVNNPAAANGNSHPI